MAQQKRNSESGEWPTGTTFEEAHRVFLQLDRSSQMQFIDVMMASVEPIPFRHTPSSGEGRSNNNNNNNNNGNSTAGLSVDVNHADDSTDDEQGDEQGNDQRCDGSEMSLQHESAKIEPVTSGSASFGGRAECSFTPPYQPSSFSEVSSNRASSASETSIPLSSLATQPDYSAKRLLPTSFLPHSHTVIFGRGKVINTSAGNLGLVRLVQSRLQEYVSTQSRQRKSAIVSDTIDTIRESSNHEGAFVRQDRDGRYWEETEADAREKVGTVFRNLLKHRYRSSSFSKTQRIKEQRATRKKQIPQSAQAGMTALDHSQGSGEPGSAGAPRRVSGAGSGGSSC